MRDSRSGVSFLFIAAPAFRFPRDRSLRRLRFPLVNKNLKSEQAVPGLALNDATVFH
jgi:hypothetical protein